MFSILLHRAVVHPMSHIATCICVFSVVESYGIEIVFFSCNNHFVDGQKWNGMKKKNWSIMKVPPNEPYRTRTMTILHPNVIVVNSHQTTTINACVHCWNEQLLLLLLNIRQIQLVAAATPQQNYNRIATNRDRWIDSCIRSDIHERTVIDG